MFVMVPICKYKAESVFPIEMNEETAPQK